MTISCSSCWSALMNILICLPVTCSISILPSKCSSLNYYKLSHTLPGFPSKMKSYQSWNVQNSCLLQSNSRSLSSGPLTSFDVDDADVAIDLFSSKSDNKLAYTFLTLQSTFIHGCSAISCKVGLLVGSYENIFRIKSLKSFDNYSPSVFFQQVQQSPFSNKL